MRGIQPHTGSNINNSQIIHDIKNRHSQKNVLMCTTNHFEICISFFGLLVHNRYWSLNDHHTSQIYISDTQHAHEINVYTTNHFKRHVQASGHRSIPTRRKMS